MITPGALDCCIYPSWSIIILGSAIHGKDGRLLCETTLHNTAAQLSPSLHLRSTTVPASPTNKQHIEAEGEPRAFPSCGAVITVTSEARLAQNKVRNSNVQWDRNDCLHVLTLNSLETVRPV